MKKSLCPASLVSSQTFLCPARYPRVQVIAAEGEQKAARALKEASDIISESPAALQLRYRHPTVFLQFAHFGSRALGLLLN